MNVERAILIAFIGNYLINTVVAALVALIPASTGGGLLTPQYITFVVLALIVTALLAWWYMQGARARLQSGVIFGVIGFVTAIVVAFITGIAGVLAQTGSFASVASVLPNFWPFLANWSTLVLAAYWIIPTALMGWYMTPRAMAMPASRPMGSM